MEEEKTEIGGQMSEVEGQNDAVLCSNCGKRPAVVDEFGDVVHGLCGQCRGGITKKGKGKKGGKAGRPPARKSLNLDITSYPEIMEGLADAAVVHIRTLEHQAIAYIVAGLQKDGHGDKGVSQA